MNNPEQAQKDVNEFLMEGCQEAFEELITGKSWEFEKVQAHTGLEYRPMNLQENWEYFQLAWKESRARLLASFTMNVVGWRRSQTSGGGEWIHQFHETEPPLNGYRATTKVEALVVLPTGVNSLVSK